MQRARIDGHHELRFDQRVEIALRCFFVLSRRTALKLPALDRSEVATEIFACGQVARNLSVKRDI